MIHFSQWWHLLAKGHIRITLSSANRNVASEYEALDHDNSMTFMTDGEGDDGNGKGDGDDDDRDYDMIIFIVIILTIIVIIIIIIKPFISLTTSMI